MAVWVSREPDPRADAPVFSVLAGIGLGHCRALDADPPYSDWFNSAIILHLFISDDYTSAGSGIVESSTVWRAEQAIDLPKNGEAL